MNAGTLPAPGLGARRTGFPLPWPPCSRWPLRRSRARSRGRTSGRWWRCTDGSPVLAAFAPRRDGVDHVRRCRTARCQPHSILATRGALRLARRLPRRHRLPSRRLRLEWGRSSRAPRRHGPRARHRPDPAQHDHRLADPRGRPATGCRACSSLCRSQLRDGQHLPLQRLRQRLQERGRHAHRDVSPQVARCHLRPRADRGRRLARHAGRQGLAEVGGHARRTGRLARLPAHHASHRARERRGEEPGQPRRADHQDARQLERRAAGARPRDRPPGQAAQPRALRGRVRRRYKKPIPMDDLARRLTAVDGDRRRLGRPHGHGPAQDDITVMAPKTAVP